ncbi:MAG: hypothetical protein ACE14L_15125 [Terriglobales bacterium]
MSSGALVQPESEFRQPRASLAQRLEAAHEWCILQYAQSLARIRPPLNAAWLAIAGGHALYTGPSPFTFAIGIAMHQAITPAELDEIEEFFHSRKFSSVVEVCPYSHPSLMQLLRVRGYRPGEVTTVLFRSLRHGPALAGPPGEIQVRLADAHEAGLWVETMAQNFFVGDPGPEARANIAALFAVPGSLNTLAFIDGELAGVAGGMLRGGDEVVPFFGSCTLPKFRRRGVHGALLNFRLRQVRDCGGDLVVMTAIPGSDSERNAQRYGFTVVYEKQAWVKAPE